jgi:hypothetical protein
MGPCTAPWQSRRLQAKGDDPFSGVYMSAWGKGWFHQAHMLRVQEDITTGPPLLKARW